MNKILYRVVDILKITGFSRSTLYKMIGDGRFPTPKKDREIRLLEKRANRHLVRATLINKWRNKAMTNLNNQQRYMEYVRETIHEYGQGLIKVSPTCY